MAEIVPVVSEALEAQVRDLLPSQRGFTEDLQASNVILPIIDLTAAAEGSTTPEFLQRAMDFASDSKLAANNTQTLANTPGFWQISYQFSMGGNTGGDEEGSIGVTDGLSTKKLINFWVRDNVTNPPGNYGQEGVIVVYLNAGESVTSTSTDVDVRVATSTRQIATSNGTLVNPTGYTPQ